MRKCCSALVLTAILAISCFSGCSSHVNLTKAQMSNLHTQTVSGITFGVPEDAFSSAVDYHSYTDVEYPEIEDADAARITLSNTAVFGTQGTDYLVTSNKEYLFYFWCASDASLDMTTVTRDELIDIVDIKDMQITDYGRMIVNSDDVDKAVIRVNFKNKGFNRTVFSYQGYLSVFNSAGKIYCFISGYCSATEADIKTCLTCAKSLGNGGIAG